MSRSSPSTCSLPSKLRDFLFAPERGLWTLSSDLPLPGYLRRGPVLCHPAQPPRRCSASLSLSPFPPRPYRLYDNSSPLTSGILPTLPWLVSEGSTLGGGSAGLPYRNAGYSQPIGKNKKKKKQQQQHRKKRSRLGRIRSKVSEGRPVFLADSNNETVFLRQFIPLPILMSNTSFDMRCSVWFARFNNKPPSSLPFCKSVMDRGQKSCNKRRYRCGACLHLQRDSDSFGWLVFLRDNK